MSVWAVVLTSDSYLSGKKTKSFHKQDETHKQLIMSEEIVYNYNRCMHYMPAKTSLNSVLLILL